MVEVLMVDFNCQSSSPDNLMLLTKAACREVHRCRGPRTASHSQLQVYLVACLPDKETTEVRSPLTAVSCVHCRSRSVQGANERQPDKVWPAGQPDVSSSVSALTYILRCTHHRWHCWVMSGLLPSCRLTCTFGQLPIAAIAAALSFVALL